MSAVLSLVKFITSSVFPWLCRDVNQEIVSSSDAFEVMTRQLLLVFLKRAIKELSILPMAVT